MKNITDTKENIIIAATELIERSNGTINSITAWAIADKAGIGLGLINYHFGSKDNLITICVQRIIGKVIAKFDMIKEYATDKERLTAWAIYVFDFLFKNSAISRISILGDMQNYTINCNSVYTQKRFMLALTKDIKDKDKPLFSFLLTSVMQTAFLCGSAVKEVLGYDFTQQADRIAFIENLVNVIFKE